MSDAPKQAQASAGPRRRVGQVTQNACTECRKKRSKCDGAHPCSRCATHGTECQYEAPVKQTKDDMRVEIEDLRNYKKRADMVLSALGRGDDTEVNEIMTRLKRSRPLEEIHQWITAGPAKVQGGFQTTYEDEMHKLAIYNAIGKAGLIPPGETPDNGNYEMMSHMSIGIRNQEQNPSPMNTEVHSYQTSTVGGTPGLDVPHQEAPLITNWSRSPSEATIEESRRAGQRTLLGSAIEREPQYGEIEESIPPTWTRLTDNLAWVEHLMTLYFCWEYPTFASLSKDHFLRDFRDRRRRYCSPLLVNAMLALGCRFSDLPAARANPNDPTTAGDHFFAEAKRLLGTERSMDALASIQALGLMTIREGSCGRDTESFYYCQLAIRIAVEIGLHHETLIADPAEREVRRATFWGAFTLDQCWSLNLSKMPHLSYCSSFPPKPSIVAESEAQLWKPYNDWGEPQYHFTNQPCNVHSVYKCFCDLNNLTHASLYKLYSPQKRFTCQDLVYHYETYMNWYAEMPPVLRLGINYTPSVIFVHIYYHFAVLSLFLPFINLRLRGSSIVPREVVMDSAIYLAERINLYHALYSLARTPSMAPYLLLTSTIALMKALVDEGFGRREEGKGDVKGKGKARGQEAAWQAGGDEDWRQINPSNMTGIQALRASIKGLQEMTKCHGFASRALEIVKYLAEKWGLDVVVGLRKDRGGVAASEGRSATFSTNAQGGDVNMADASEPQTEGQATAQGGQGQSQAGPSAHIRADWERVKPKANSTNLFVPRGVIDDNDDESVLFSIFPLQGVPLVGEGRDLEADGFIVDKGTDGSNGRDEEEEDIYDA